MTRQQPQTLLLMMPASTTMTSGFSATCSRLSQYLKENGGIAPPRPPPITTMNLFPLQAGSADEDAGCGRTKSQLTIFYGGEILVFDDFPADKVEDLMRMARCNGTAPLTADLPIARRGSLHRFLEKRKDRIAAAGAPYQVPYGRRMPEVAQEIWLGLGRQGSKPAMSSGSS